MSNAIYPVLPGLQLPVRRTPIWRTKVDTTPSGREFRSGAMLTPRYRYGLTYEFLRSAAAFGEYQALFGFFNLRRGGWDTFLFSDPDDNAVSAQLFGTGTGSATAFQLVRTVGGFAHPVFDVDSSVAAPQIFVAGVLKTAGTHYSISSTGLVTFTTAPASGAAITWTGSFYWRCRFETDEMQLDRFMAGFWKTGEVRLLTVKP